MKSDGRNRSQRNRKRKKEGQERGASVLVVLLLFLLLFSLIISIYSIDIHFLSFTESLLDIITSYHGVLTSTTTTTTTTTPFPPPSRSSALLACSRSRSISPRIPNFSPFPLFKLNCVFLSPHSSVSSFFASSVPISYTWTAYLSSKVVQPIPRPLSQIFSYLCVLVSTAIPSLLIPKLLIVEATLPQLDWRWFRAPGHS